MKQKRIRQLLKLLPDKTTYPPVPPPSGAYGRVAHRLLTLQRHGQCVNDPQFGYRFVRCFIELGLPLPPDVHDSLLRRIYNSLVHAEPDLAIEDALMIEHSASPLLRALIKAGLIDPAMSIAAISDRLQVPIEVIETYGELFWNVRDRLDDEPYIVHLVYPETRLVEFQEGYFKKESVENLLLRAAYNHGIDTALEFAGFSSRKETDVEQIAREMEQIIISTALLLSKLGAINEPKMPVMKNALRTILAGKRARSMDSTTTEKVPSDEASFDTILETIQKLHVPDMPQVPGVQQHIEPAAMERL